MSTVKANWHLGDLDLPQDDPMAAIAQLQSEGEPILLDKPSAMLMNTIVVSLRREANFKRMFGLTCDLKWTVDLASEAMLRNPCRSCPHFTADESVERSLLCRLGHEQETMIDSYYTALSTEGLDDQLVAAFAADADAALELAEATL